MELHEWTNTAQRPMMLAKRGPDAIYDAMGVLDIPKCASADIMGLVLAGTGKDLLVSHKSIYTRDQQYLPTFNLGYRSGGVASAEQATLVPGKGAIGKATIARCADGREFHVAYFPNTCQNLGLLTTTDLPPSWNPPDTPGVPHGNAPSPGTLTLFIAGLLLLWALSNIYPRGPRH